MAARVAEMDAQAARELEETLAVLAEADAAMLPRATGSDLTYDAFRGEAVVPDPTETAATEQTADVETD